MMFDRDHRDNRDMSRTCSDQCDRDKRDTPLKGVTAVTLVANELDHDWTAQHPRKPRQGVAKSLGRSTHVARMVASTRIRNSNHGGCHAGDRGDDQSLARPALEPHWSASMRTDTSDFRAAADNPRPYQSLAPAPVGPRMDTSIYQTKDFKSC